MFWKMSYADTSPIDAVLERADFTLEDLLDEDHIIQESKGENEKLLAYLTKEDVLAQLIQYVVTAKDPATEDKVRLKYPYVASELLSLELEVIYGSILRNEELCKSLFGFLSSPSVSDSLLCGYFQKVVSQFLSKSPVPCINRIRQLNVVGGLIDNINSFAMVELLLRLASLPEDPNVSVPADELQWLAESDFVRRLVLLLHSPDADSQSHAHVALTGLIRSSQLRSPSVITRAVVDRSTVENVFHGIQTNGFAASSASLGVLVELISKCVAETTNEDSNDQCADVVSVIVSVIVGQLDALIAFVRSDLPATTLSSVTTTIRTAQPLLGMARLRVVEALGHMLRLPHEVAQKACADHNIAVECVQLFPRYRWHSILHSTVLSMVNAVLANPVMRDAAIKGGLLRAITAAARQDMQDGRVHRLSYMAQVVKIVVQLKDLAKKDDQVREAIEADREFKEVLEHSIEPSLFKDSVVIAGCGQDPRNEPSPSPDRPNFSNFQLGNSSIGDSANEEMVQVADSADDNPWHADFESSDAQNGLQRADEQGKNSSDEDD
jgi:serine/threonine-protein phosphatase 6 regulatory subunit 3